MKANAEMRKDSKLAIQGGWLWRLLCTFVILQFVAQMAARLLTQLNESRGVMSLGDFMQKKLAALQQGLDYTLPTQEAYSQMWISTGFEYFVGTVFGAIALFGLTAVALKALEKSEQGWFSAGLGGFRRPLEVTALLLVQNLIVGFWTLFFIVPGIVAAYRYRQAWYLKCEHPEWGALRCLGESAKMMKGYKAQAFCFDLGYIGWAFLVALGAGIGYAVASGENGLVMAIGLLIVSVSLVFAMYVMIWFVAGRAVFYRELKSVLKTETQDDLPRND